MQMGENAQIAVAKTIMQSKNRNKIKIRFRLDMLYHEKPRKRLFSLKWVA